MAMTVSRPTVHFGGALGGAGLAATLGLCAWIATSVAPANGEQLMSATLSPSAPIAIESDANTIDDMAGVPALEQTFPDAQPGNVDIAAVQNASGAVVPLPAPVQPVADDPAPVAAPATVQTATADRAPVQATFIVKFTPNRALDSVVATWRRDREAAEATFADWAGDQPVFANARLVGCSYSGELIIQRPVPTGDGGVDAVTEMIRSHPAVSYADPDFTAHPGEFED